MKDPAILQYEAWSNIINSPDWRYFQEWVGEHIVFENKQALRAIDSGKMNEAMKHQAIAKDWGKVLDKIDAKIKELKESMKNNG